MFIKGRKSAQIESHLLILQNGIHLLHHLDKICDFLYKRWVICNAAKNLALFYNIFNTKIELETLTRNVQRHVRSNAKKQKMLIERNASAARAVRDLLEVLGGSGSPPDTVVRGRAGPAKRSHCTRLRVS